MKDLKPMNKVISGVNLGDYEFIPETIISNAEKYGYGKSFRWATIRCDEVDIEDHFFYEWAGYFKENGIYFNLDNSQTALQLSGQGRKSTLKKEVVDRINEIAGEYFLGADMSEFGSAYSSKAKGYKRRYIRDNIWDMPQAIHPIQGFKTVQEARDNYVGSLKKHVDINRELGMRTISSEAVTLLEYCFEAGVDVAILELVPRNMEQIATFGRGAVRAYEKEPFGVWLAHEWYGGYRPEDPLKARRLTLEYFYSYLAGADFITLDSGYRGLHMHGVDYDENHPLAKAYYRQALDFAKFCDEDVRPAKGPITKVAFVKGNLDGFGWGNSSSLWGQYYDERWGFSAPEYSYRIFDEVYRKLDWCDAKNFGEYDYSNAPAYGQYDVVPIAAPLHVLQQYDWLIFTGWNTMTREIFDKLKHYVAQGGKLLIGACHLRDSIDRSKMGEFVCPEEYEEFFGCEFTDDFIRSNDGYKFTHESTIEGIQYPSPPGMVCDPAWSAGYTDYVRIKPGKAKTVCMLADSFYNEMSYTDPIIFENKYGQGTVVFMANSEYPGAPEVFPLYKIVVKEILAATHRTSDLKVIASDRVRFAVYESDDKYKVYLLNTDYDLECKVKVMFGEQTAERTILSIGMEIVEFHK